MRVKLDRFYSSSVFVVVSSANKKDVRTIEQVMADTKARKKQKIQHDSQTTSTSITETPTQQQQQQQQQPCDTQSTESRDAS